MTRSNTKHSCGRRCAKCSAPAVDRYRGQWLCAEHLNPDLPPTTVEQVTLVCSNWAPFDELERMRGMGSRNYKAR